RSARAVPALPRVLGDPPRRRTVAGLAADAVLGQAPRGAGYRVAAETAVGVARALEPVGRTRRGVRDAEPPRDRERAGGPQHVVGPGVAVPALPGDVLVLEAGLRVGPRHRAAVAGGGRAPHHPPPIPPPPPP